MTKDLCHSLGPSLSRGSTVWQSELTSIIQLKINPFYCNCNLFPMEHLGVHKNLVKYVRAFQIDLEFGSVGF